MNKEEETNIRQYIVSQRILIQQLEDRIQNLIDDVETLHEHVHTLEQSLLMRDCSNLIAMEPPG